jgi:hypothetical protein
VKFYVTFSLLILFSSLASADLYFKDVPQGHWAEEAVYEMVRMGVTYGFPDGTFRGNRAISRFEISSFLSKYYRYFNLRKGENDKLIEELRSELSIIQYEKKRAAWETQISGEYDLGFRSTANQAARFEPQLKLSLLKRSEAQSSLRINLDTMDAGFGPYWSSESLLSLIDFAIDFKLGYWSGVANFGPGRVKHLEKYGWFPSENNTFFQRPWPELKLTSSVANTKFSVAYLARQTAADGKIDLHELTGKITSVFGNWQYAFQPHYLFVSDGPHDILTDFGISYQRSNWQINALVSVGSWSDSWYGCYAKLEGEAKDPWKTGTNLVLRLDSVGGKYRIKGLDEFELVDLNYFNRLIFDNNFDFGLKVKQQLNRGFWLELVNDYVINNNFNYGEKYPESYRLSRVTLGYSLSPASELNLFYQNYQVPSGLAQFYDPVPKVSETLGFGLKSSF